MITFINQQPFADDLLIIVLRRGQKFSICGICSRLVLQKRISSYLRITHHDHTMCVTQVASDTLSGDVDNCFAGAMVVPLLMIAIAR